MPPMLLLPREEWPEADFVFPDDDTADDDTADDDDWDIDLHLSTTGGEKAQAVRAGIAARADSFSSHRPTTPVFTIRPPLPSTSATSDEDDEGMSTIKALGTIKATDASNGDTLRPTPTPTPTPTSTPAVATAEDDFEDDFALPEDLTQLSLRAPSLAHRSSKFSLEWGDKDQTSSSSSQSSDAYSLLGFLDTEPSSSYTSASLPESECESECEADDRSSGSGALDGLEIPAELFESSRKLSSFLERRKKTAFAERQARTKAKGGRVEEDNDFEKDLVIEDDVELSPSRLLQNANANAHPKRTMATVAAAAMMIRSKSVPPPRAPTLIRPPSRVRTDRARSPANPPISNAHQLRRLGAPAAPLQPQPQTYSQVTAAVAGASATSPAPSPSFLTPKPGSLRVQKSHSGLKPPSPQSTRRLSRKASLPSLSEPSDAATTALLTANATNVARSYITPTASSRAKSHAGRPGEYTVPPARPSTPSANPAALRLTMPTSTSRTKLRPAISTVFPPLPSSSSAAAASPSSSMLPVPSPRPTPAQQASGGPKILKRPKRARMYGDGSELDGFADLPLDGEKEGRYRVQPRVPGAAYSRASATSTRRKLKRDASGGSLEMAKMGAPATKTLKRTQRIEFGQQQQQQPLPQEQGTKKKSVTKRKPTLIRNLNSTTVPKVVDGMKWNPATLRWEGNDGALREFDSAPRPALITQLTGSSVGGGVSTAAGASGARVVGTMAFDPARMCWVSTLPPEEDEPDVFADLADDEDEDAWGTIRLANANANAGATPRPAAVAAEKNGAGGEWGARTERERDDGREKDGGWSRGGSRSASPSRSHSRSMSEGESDRGSRASMVCDVDAAFVERCRAAEARHVLEMGGWVRVGAAGDAARAYLYEIRALATRQY